MIPYGISIVEGLFMYFYSGRAVAFLMIGMVLVGGRDLLDAAIPSVTVPGVVEVVSVKRQCMLETRNTGNANTAYFVDCARARAMKKDMDTGQLHRERTHLRRLNMVKVRYRYFNSNTGNWEQSTFHLKASDRRVRKLRRGVRLQVEMSRSGREVFLPKKIVIVPKNGKIERAAHDAAPHR